MIEQRPEGAFSGSEGPVVRALRERETGFTQRHAMIFR